jgi:hypothetical protein
MPGFASLWCASFRPDGEPRRGRRGARLISLFEYIVRMLHPRDEAIGTVFFTTVRSELQLL